MCYWKCELFLLLFHHASAFQNLTGNISFHDPAEMGINMNEMTLTTYFSLANESRGYPRYTNYIADAEHETRRFFEWFPLKHWGTDRDIIHACYYIHTTYRNAMTDLRRYFSRRTLYKSTLEYEIGYLTHEVVWRYRTILEVYHYLVKWYYGYPNRNLAPTILVFYMYTNILQQSIVIINLCNMMHELEKKYRMPREKGVFDDYERGGSGGGGPGTSSGGSKDKNKYNVSVVDEHLAAYEAYLANLRKEARKKRKEAKEMRKQVLKLGNYTTRGKATAKSYWPLHYGWSIENW